MTYKDYFRKNKGSKFHALRSWLTDAFTFFLNSKGIDKELDFDNKKKILIISNGHIGDTVLSTAVFREIKKRYPRTDIHVLTTELSKPILEENKNIDKLIVSKLFWRKESRNWKALKGYSQLIKKLRNERYDIGIALRSDLPNILTLYLSGIRKTFGYYNLDGGKHLLTNPILYPEQEQHASIADLKLVNEAWLLDFNGLNNFPDIPVSNSDIAYAGLTMDIANLDHYICIVPGACAKLQTWSPEKYKEIINWVSKEYPKYKIVLAGGEADRSLLESLSLSLSNSTCVKLINHPLRQLGLIFKAADCVLLQDGGPMHLAYAMMKEKADKRLLVLWGPNPLDHVRPLKGKIIHHKLDCYPCMRQESQCKKPEGQRCMDFITIEEVKKEMKKIL